MKRRQLNAMTQRTKHIANTNQMVLMQVIQNKEIKTIDLIKRQLIN